jgi:alpha-beta hydrolase superfamily lysophospholipase
MRRWLARAGWFVTGALALVSLAHVVRVYREEEGCFHPRRGRVDVPASLADLPGRRDVEFAAQGGAALRGWYFASHNRAAVVLVHGSSADRAQLAVQARVLVDAGFGVLVFDLPGHGESEGSVKYGQPEREAIGAAVHFVAGQPDVDPSRVGALGLSVGAALVAVAAAGEPAIRALVLVSPFTDSEDQAKADMRGRRSRTPWLDEAVVLAIDRHYMTDGPLRPIDAVGRFGGRPLLVVAAADDHVVPLWMSREVHDAADASKELLVLPSGGHANVDALTSDPCRARVLDFLGRALAGDLVTSRSGKDRSTP